MDQDSHNETTREKPLEASDQGLELYQIYDLKEGATLFMMYNSCKLSMVTTKVMGLYNQIVVAPVLRGVVMCIRLAKGRKTRGVSAIQIKLSQYTLSPMYTKT